MDFLEYIIEEALILIPVLLIIGKVIKNAQYIPDKHIPVVLLVIGIVASGFIMGWSVDAVIQGVLVAGASVFGHQIVIQAKKEE